MLLSAFLFIYDIENLMAGLRAYEPYKHKNEGPIDLRVKAQKNFEGPKF